MDIVAISFVNHVLVSYHRLYNSIYAQYPLFLCENLVNLVTGHTHPIVLSSTDSIVCYLCKHLAQTTIQRSPEQQLCQKIITRTIQT